MGLDTKTYWLTERQSQCDFDFDFDFDFWLGIQFSCWVQLKVQLWDVNQRTTEAKIRYQETSSEDAGEELPLWIAVTK
jgi:hypothetical protein